ncbi:hypothetical protein BOW55_18870, partial [Flavobacterium sp. YO12]
MDFALFGIVLFILIFLDLYIQDDLVEWIIRSLVLIILFLMIQYSFVNSICEIIFRLAKKMKSEKGKNKYRISFTDVLSMFIRRLVISHINGIKLKKQ